jgi:prevent-host-death family protein
MSEKRWQLQEAKNQLSELVRKARKDGPQVITLRGDDAVVVVDATEYARLAKRPKQSLVEFLRRSPLAGAQLEVSRSRDTGRTVDL